MAFRGKRRNPDHPDSWIFGPKRSIRRDVGTVVAENRPPVAGIAAVAVVLLGLVLLSPVSPISPVSSDSAGDDGVGVPEGTDLETHEGRLRVTEDGAVVDAMDVHGAIWVMADDVTITRTRVTHRSWHGIRIFSGATGTVIEESEVECEDRGPDGAKGIAFGNYTAERVEVTGCRRGFDAVSNTTVTDSLWNGDEVEFTVGRRGVGSPAAPPTTAPPTTATTAPPATTTTAPPPPPTTAPAAPAPRPPSGGLPGPDNTGPSGNLVRRTAAQIEDMMRPGAVIENVEIVGGNIDVLADNVTIRNFRVDAAGAQYAFISCGPDGECSTPGDQHTGFVAENGEIVNTAAAAFWGSHATFRRLEVHEGGGDAFKPLTHVTIESTWWHHLGKGEGAHADGVQFQGGGTNNHIRNNNCDMPDTVRAPYHTNACVIVSTTQSLSVEIHGNFLNSGNHIIYCNNQRGVSVYDNRFGRDHRWDGVLSECPSVRNNVWFDTLAPL